MLLGYNTNGMAHHRLLDAVALLAEIGYQSVAITIDHGVLSPSADNRPEQIARLKNALRQHGLRSVIETGARFLLDPRHKHEPTLLTADPDARARRLDFYRYAVDCAAELGSDCVSIWSGVLHDPIPKERAMDRLAEGLREVLGYAQTRGVTIAFEPEPGMLVDSISAFDELADRVGSEPLRLTLDIGHLHCSGEVSIAEVIRRYASRLANVHLEDMRRGVHEHLMFGQGEIDFPPVLQTLTEVGYSDGVYVELSRHSHQAPEVAKRAFDFLQPMI